MVLKSLWPSVYSTLCLCTHCGNYMKWLFIYFARNRREDNDIIEFESDSWSDDSGSDNISRSLSNNSSKAWDAVSEDSCCEQEGSWPRDRLGYLYLQYNEMSSPYWRVPLMDKVAYSFQLRITEPHFAGGTNEFICILDLDVTSLMIISHFR